MHSSTLVTAGVYLLIRYESLIFDTKILTGILVLGGITRILAGVQALGEVDIKKIVALSTLRQLGLIVAILGIGLTNLAFVHLVIHAFLKALIFIAVGTIIYFCRRLQDTRLSPIILGAGRYLPVWSVVFSSFGLIAFPFLGSAFSKEVAVEIILIRLNGFLGLSLIALRVLISALYFIKFIVKVTSATKHAPPVSFRRVPSKGLIIRQLALCLTRVCASSVILKNFFQEPVGGSI